MSKAILMARLVAASAFTLAAALAADGAETVPDFAGVWGRNTIDYSAPATGKGPIQNISGSRNVMVGDYKDPMLKPWAAEIVKRNGEIAKTGDAFPTAHNQCWPEPPPYILGNQQLQVLQQKDQVTLMYSHSSQVRRVRLNGSHPATLTPSWYGDSIGHYEGDTLIVDTVGIAVAPLSTVDRYGTPHTEALHVVERFSMVEQSRVSAEPVRNGGFQGVNDDAVDRGYKGKVLRVDFTVDDPGTFTMPWSGAVVYNRAKGLFIEDVCAENIHDYVTGRDSAVPVAKTTLLVGD
ncbi:MAG TPA: hypothetical protein VNH44_13585 [Micropepsaceae bacterium]|nr:hypothetical protein [Micropepsaceae bacterium]